MGGACFQVGIITPAAGFKISVEPEAAQIVFRSGLPPVVMPLDVPHKAPDPARLGEGDAALRPPVRQPVASRTDVFEHLDTANSGSEDAPLHDPCAVAHLLPPALFQARHITVGIGTKGEHTPGKTVADGCRVTARAPRAVAMGGVDREGFYRLLTERLGGS
jgi:purine nucleosidase